MFRAWVGLLILFFASCAAGFRTDLQEVGSVYGFVTNNSYEPLDSAQVEIIGEGGLITYTNQAGYYLLADVITGDYSLLVTKPGYAAQTVGLHVASRRKKEINVCLVPEPQQQGQISGLVVDYMTKMPLVVDVIIMDHNRTATTDDQGRFTFYDLAPGNYLLKYQALDYVDVFSEVQVLPGRTTEIVKPMLRRNAVITLYGVEFDFGKFTLKPESYPVLDSAAGILNNFPEVEVEIHGHTDAIGSDEANLILSQKRAEAVRQYLIDVHMIEPVRLIARGFGESRPIADNNTEAGRARNRRVEFVVAK